MFRRRRNVVYRTSICRFNGIYYGFMTISAPAKLNLHLAVLDTRSDGFHNLESLFTAIDLEDLLHFEVKIGQILPLELIIEGPEAIGLDIPLEKNLIYRAFSLFIDKCLSTEKTGCSGNANPPALQLFNPSALHNSGLKIRLEKRIPVGGGLGGGSSNAASTLLALNSLADYPLEKADLLELGAALGSDVPFFLSQTPAAWVTGRGENIEPVEIPPWRFVLVNPGFKSDTALAYKLLDKSRGSGERVAGSGERDINVINHIDLLKIKAYKQGSSALYPLPSTLLKNDFLAVLPEKSTYNAIISQLTALGAEYANLSGSGSTCFGVFKDKEQAENAVQILKKDWLFVKSCGVKIN